MSKKLCVFILTSLSLFLFSCQFEVLKSNDGTTEEIVIGDEVIYGEEFSLGVIYSENARAASISEDQLTEMVYFSVCPTSVDEVYKVNETMGFLNPIMMNKEIIQACDSESLIMKNDIELNDDIDAEDLLNVGINYYYIVEKSKSFELENTLENYSVIEEFSMPKEEYLEEADEGRAARKIFGKSYINGKAQYSIGGKTVPAYGIKMRRGFSHTNETNIKGEFSLGYSRNIWGLSWIWADYVNDACILSNVLNLNASTLLKVAFPSKLTGVTINATSEYATAKMAICNEILRRYEQEKKRGNSLKRAIVWTTQLGNGTSSAPCFDYLGNENMVDIFLTGCKNYASNAGFLKVVHHEYTHYMHCLSTKNKNGFYNNVIESEIKSSVKSTIINFVNKILETNFKAEFYDFSNKYVLFTENLSEWYSLVGFENGAYGEAAKVTKYYGEKIGSSTYDCQNVFAKLVEKKVLTAEDIIKIICSDKTITFQEFYDSTVKYYPYRKKDIENVFKDYYKPHRNTLKY